MLNDVLTNYKKLEYSELQKRARDDYALLLPVFSSLAGDQSGKRCVIIFVGAALAADGVLSLPERAFLCELLNITDEEAERFMKKHMGEKAASLADRIFDICSPQMKEVLLDFCLCFLAVDKDIPPEEISFITRLLA